MKVYVLVGIWQGTVENVLVYADKDRAELARKNLQKGYGKLGNVTIEEKEVIEHGA